MDAACCLCDVVVKMCSEVGLQEPKAVSTATISPRPRRTSASAKAWRSCRRGQQSFGTMTVDENLHVVAGRYGSEAKARYDEAVTMFPVLKEFAVERADRYYGWPPGASSPPAKAVLHRLRPPKRPCAYNRALKTRRYKALFERQSLYLRVLRAPIAEPSSKKPHDPLPGRCNGRFLSCRLRL